MVSNSPARCALYLAALVSWCAASTAFGAAGFITGSAVDGGSRIAEISIRLACQVDYLGHLPENRGDRLRIQLEATAVCQGVSPTIASSREQHRPRDAGKARIQEIEYDGDTSAGQTLTLNFSESVRFEVMSANASDIVTVRIFFDDASPTSSASSGATGIRVLSMPGTNPQYVLNLSSSRNRHAESEKLLVDATSGLKVYETEVLLSGVSWYRLRLGNFPTEGEARRYLAELHDRFPSAWVDRASTADAPTSITPADQNEATIPAYAPTTALASVGLDQVDQLMADARRAMVAGNTSAAIQIYTKVLRIPDHDRHAQALEYLALAREKNGQLAHAKAEYQRYLSIYPDSDGTRRVSQRLAALLATDRPPDRSVGTTTASVRSGTKSAASNWRVQTFLSQYYRRDVNQFDEEENLVSQSALYSDINVDARRRGARFDFSSRLSAGHRNDFLGEDLGSGDLLRVSYAYADLADARTGLRGRIGRQSRTSGGILGRFDGVNLGYLATDRILINAVAGHPVNSAADSVNNDRTFYGASINYGPILESLELGAFYIQQAIDGYSDRQAVGTEFRYFGDNQSLWGLIDYDTSYKEIGSAFLQGSWRILPRLSLHGSYDRRHTPYLSTRNALIGQPVETFSELLVFYTEDEIRQFSLDRAPLATSVMLGLSYSLTPKLQLNVDANKTEVGAAPESGGVPGSPQTSYKFYSATLVASSLLREGDVTMFALRASDSDTVKMMSLNIDSRFPVGQSWRINPRLRVDRRQVLSNATLEWRFTPAIRILFRRSQKYRVELETGRFFSRSDFAGNNIDRDSYFLNLGYQAFF